MMEKVLVIEDSIEVLQNIIQLLEMKGYHTVSAENGKIGLEVAKKELPDLIVCDVMMPEMDGYGLLDELKKIPSTSNIPFIFLSAKADRADLRKGMVEGADDYITKPFKAMDLLEAIEARLKIKKKNEKIYEEAYHNISTYIPHELRTPLVAILGFSDLIIDNLDGIPQQEIAEMLNRIKVAGRRVHNTIEKFIIYSEVEMLNQNKKKNEDVLLSKTKICDVLIDEIIKRNLLESGRIGDIDYYIEEKEVFIWEEHLTIILKELLENAVKFSTLGDKIIIRSYTQDDKYFVEIKDNGRGMNRAQISKIKPFIQHERHTFQQSGNGLGLATVQRITKFYNSILDIESEAGEFTLVRFSLNLKSKIGKPVYINPLNIQHKVKES